jgi:hypothetical protein
VRRWSLYGDGEEVGAVHVGGRWLDTSVVVAGWTDPEAEALYTVGGAEAVRRRLALYTVTEAETGAVH